MVLPSRKRDAGVATISLYSGRRVSSCGGSIDTLAAIFFVGSSTPSADSMLTLEMLGMIRTHHLPTVAIRKPRQTCVCFPAAGAGHVPSARALTSTSCFHPSSPAFLSSQFPSARDRASTPLNTASCDPCTSTMRIGISDVRTSPSQAPDSRIAVVSSAYCRVLYRSLSEYFPGFRPSIHQFVPIASSHHTQVPWRPPVYTLAEPLTVTVLPGASAT